MSPAWLAQGKVEAYNKMTELCDDLLTICEMAIEENDESMLEELESGYKELEDGIAEQNAAHAADRRVR